jgi:23S rRNA (pseudouridine1915-N3)-methyltransferase
MKTVLCVVGKTDDGYINEGIRNYTQRVNRYAPFEMMVLPDLKNTKGMTEAIQKEKEGEMILKKLLPGDILILLDENGKEYNSIEMASWLQNIFNQSSKRLVFVIGGPYGFSSSVYKKAHAQISLSRLTFSHQLVRLLFMEQLYRCHTIINGEPYHHA